MSATAAPPPNKNLVTASASASGSGAPQQKSIDADVLDAMLSLPADGDMTRWWPRKTSFADCTTLDELVGVFHRPTVNLDMSGSHPLPEHSPSVINSERTPQPIQVDGNLKLHKSKTTLDLQHMGFTITLCENKDPYEAKSEAEVQKAPLYQPLIDKLANEEIYRRTCPGARPSFIGHTWLSRISGYMTFKSGLAEYAGMVLGHEVCQFAEELSFIFGDTRNPISPLLDAQPMDLDSPSTSELPNRSHMTEKARILYFRMVVMQCWLTVNQRFAIRSVDTPEKPPFIFAVSATDYLDEFRGNTPMVGGADVMLKQSIARGVKFPEAHDPRRPDIAKRIADNPKLKAAWDLASSARHLTCGHFMARVHEVYVQVTGHTIMADKTCDNLKKNTITDLCGCNFTLAHCTNMLEYHKAALRLAVTRMDERKNAVASIAAKSTALEPASSVDEAKAMIASASGSTAAPAQKTIREKKNINPFRTMQDSKRLRYEDIDRIAYNPKALIPATKNRMFLAIERGECAPAPSFLSHLRFSPVTPIVKLEFSSGIRARKTQSTITALTAGTSAFTQPPPKKQQQQQQATVDPAFFWTIAHYMCNSTLVGFGAHLSKSGFVVNARASNNNVHAYFSNPANEPSSARLYGGHMRYTTFQETYPDYYAHPNYIRRHALTIVTDPTKNATSSKKAATAAAAKAKSTAVAAADEAIDSTHPLQQSLEGGIFDPINVCVDMVLMSGFLFPERARSKNPVYLAKYNQILSHIRLLTQRFAANSTTVLLDEIMTLLSTVGLSESHMWVVMMEAQKNVMRSNAPKSTAATDYSVVVLALAKRWTMGMAEMAARRNTAFRLMRYVNTDGQDRNVLLAIERAFGPDKPTYKRDKLVNVNVEFHNRFFTYDRVRSFVIARKIIFCQAKARDKRVLLAEYRRDALLKELCNAVVGRSSYAGFDIGVRDLCEARDDDDAYVFGACILKENGHVDGAMACGPHMIDFVVDQWVRYVKHPIFSYAAYITNPPLGAVMQSTGCEWVTPVTDTVASSRRSKRKPTEPIVTDEKRPSKQKKLTTSPPPDLKTDFLRPPTPVPLTPVKSPRELSMSPSPTRPNVIISSDSRDSTCSLSPTPPTMAIDSAAAAPELPYTESFRKLREDVRVRFHAVVNKRSKFMTLLCEYVAPQNLKNPFDAAMMMALAASTESVFDLGNAKAHAKAVFAPNLRPWAATYLAKSGVEPEPAKQVSTGMDYQHLLMEIHHTGIFGEQTILDLYTQCKEAAFRTAEPVDFAKCFDTIVADLYVLYCDGMQLELTLLIRKYSQTAVCEVPSVNTQILTRILKALQLKINSSATAAAAAP